MAKESSETGIVSDLSVIEVGITEGTDRKFRRRDRPSLIVPAVQSIHYDS